MRILHLEDNANDAELIEDVIRREWPLCTIERVSGRSAYEAALRRGEFDMVLSDYSLPDFDGLAALDLARSWCPRKPFIFLSGTIGEERAVDALKRGATDYVMKDRPSRLLSSVLQAFARAEDRERQRAAEARIREQASLLDKARDAICVTGLDFRITYWNARATELYGWTSDEVMGRDLSSLIFAPDVERCAEAHARLMSAGEWSGDLRTLNRHGATLIVESRWSRVDDGEGRAVSILLLNTDVTERRRLETQLLRSQRLESIGNLAGGIAHDLNNVLAPVVMACNLLQLQLTKPEELSLVGTIENSAQHGAALIRQLLAFARGAEGKRVELNVQTALSELEMLLHSTLGRRVELTMKFTEPPRTILADVTQFNQVMLNLCVNARDAMTNGGRIEILTTNVTLDELATRAYPGVASGPYVRIAVSDTGAGIPPDIIDHIFDPFFTTKASDKGTGLGLSTVRGIMKGHEGFIFVDSTVGVGTTFTLLFPAMTEA
ncbi:MAG: PAS domain S-box protein [Opitutaceae bacterium]|nr:PAS domain S-box protein [Opitutaceae bacterium]